jgi:hypothetical protein
MTDDIVDRLRARTHLAVKGAEGKRLTYNQSNGARMEV